MKEETPKEVKIAVGVAVTIILLFVAIDAMAYTCRWIGNEWHCW